VVASAVTVERMTHSLVSGKGLQLLLDELPNGLFNGCGQAAAVLFFLAVIRLTSTGQPAALAATKTPHIT